MIAILHPGEMGTAVGRALQSAGHEVGWFSPGRSAATTRRAHEAGFVALDQIGDADIAISLCPPDAALDTARSVEGWPGTYVDANAVSPRRAREIAAVVPRCVDASVIGPPPHRHGTTRLYLAPVDDTADAAAEASRIGALFEGSVLDAVVLGAPFAASALKMSYAAWTKISSALLLTGHEAARRLGVGEALLHEWSLSQPALAQRHEQATAAARAKGWRWTGEMHEIAATLADLGLPDGFATAAAEVFDRYERDES